MNADQAANGLCWALAYSSVLALAFVLVVRSGAERRAPRTNASLLLLSLAFLGVALPVCLLALLQPDPGGASIARRIEGPFPGAGGGPFEIPGAIWIVGTWAALASVRVARHVAAAHGLRRALADATPPPAALAETFESVRFRFQVAARLVLVPDSVSPVPAVFGDRVVLPRACASFSRDELVALFAHELGHVRRLDPLAHRLQRFTEALFFFHPAVRWIARRLSEQRELACDELCVRLGTRSVDLLRALVHCAERRCAASCLAMNDGDLALRLEALARPRLAGARRVPIVQATLLPLLVVATVALAGALTALGAGPRPWGLGDLASPYRAAVLSSGGETRGWLVDGADGRRFVSFDERRFEELYRVEGDDGVDPHAPAEGDPIDRAGVTDGVWATR
ncbi:MAG: M56 family metallopeptidase [Planctomycetota bacterium]